MRIIIAVIIFFAISCEVKTACVKLMEGTCMPIKSYRNWNQCVDHCENTLTPKTKPYAPKEWMRPRPYGYP